VLECWSAGVLEGWRAGVLEGWRAGGLESKLLGVNILVVHNYVSFNGSHNQDVFVRGRQMYGQWVESVAGDHVVCCNWSVQFLPSDEDRE
jgi:hypothetical protein